MLSIASTFLMTIPLRDAELFWVKLQPFLYERGYKLRTRYDPNWKPSWQSGSWNLNPPKHHYGRYNDGVPLPHDKLMDAVRISDGTKVVLKTVNIYEDVPILQYLNSPELASDPRNKTVPLLDVIALPDGSDMALIVMPILHPFNSTVSQFRYGLVFMHEHRVAHRDACYYNLMIDPTKICPGGFHFAANDLQEDFKKPSKWLERRFVSPVKYYFIDFEMSEQLPSGPDTRLSLGIVGQDRTVPEMSMTIPYDPFKVDVFQLGGVIPELIKRYEGLEFLLPLSNSMRRRDPEARLTAAEAHDMLQEMVSSLTEADLSRRIWLRVYSPRVRKRIEFPPKPLWQRLLACFSS